MKTKTLDSLLHFNSIRCDWKFGVYNPLGTVLLYFNSIRCDWKSEKADVDSKYSAISIPLGAIGRIRLSKALLKHLDFNSIRCDWKSYFRK